MLKEAVVSEKKSSVSAYVVDDYQEYTFEGKQPRPDANKAQFDALYKWLKKMPEIKYVISTMADDILGEGYELEGAKPKIKKVQKWLRKNRFNKHLFSVLQDYFLTGNGYLGKSSITKNQVSQLIETVWKNKLSKGVSSFKKMEIMNDIEKKQPDLYTPRSLFPMKSRSMWIDYDKHGEVEAYVQKPLWKDGGKQIRYKPEEVIHFAYEPVGDEIYGTSPIQLSLGDVAGLWYAKNYAGVFFQNDATPAKIYLFKDEPADSPNVKKAKEVLRFHKAKPHLSIVMTGNVEIMDSNHWGKDLEFGKTIDMFTKRIFLPYGIVAKSAPLFESKSSKQMSPEALEGYYKKINRIQGELEEQLNVELFEHFDVEIKFKRTYKRDESREADIVTKLTGGKQILSQNEARIYLAYKPKEDKALDEISDGSSNGAFPESEVGAADARTEQNAENPSAPGKPKDETLPERGAGLETGRGRQGSQRTGKPRTEAERKERHKKLSPKVMKETYEPPETGDAPKEMKELISVAYSSCRKNNPQYSKEKCSKISWGAVKRVFERGENGKWRRKKG